VNKIFGSLFILGLSFGAGPCLASCGPLLISYIAARRKNIPKSIITYLLFSVSRILAYIVLGLLVFLSGQLISRIMLNTVPRYFFIGGGAFIVIIGFFTAIGRNSGHKLCLRLQEKFLKRDTLTVLILGLIIGIFPCLPLLSVLSYIGLVSKTWLERLLYGLFFGLGTVVSPLIILAALAGLIPRIIAQNNKLYGIVNVICGLIIIFLGARLIIRAF